MITEDKIKNAIDNGFRFLKNNCKNGRFECYISYSRDMRNQVLSKEGIGASLLALYTILKMKPELKITKDVIKYCETFLRDGKVFYFKEDSCPTDIDDTSWYLSALLDMNKAKKQDNERIADEIISNVDENGIIKVWFEPCGKENAMDHVTIANALYFLNLMNKRSNTIKNEDYVFEILKNKSYLNGSLYYHSPDSFLYCLSKLTKFKELDKRFREILGREIKERVNSTNWPFDLAMRISMSKRLGINNEVEIEKLLNLQEKDGGWPIDSIYHYRRKPRRTRIGYFGSRSMTTAFSLEALLLHM